MTEVCRPAPAGRVISFWIVTAPFCVQKGLPLKLRLQVVEAFWRRLKTTPGSG